MKFGAHMSIAGGVGKALYRGKKTGCDTIQIFTKSSNRWKSKALTPEETSGFSEAVRQTEIWPVIAHNSYLINLASPEEASNKKSLVSFIEELKRAESLNIPYLVMHPGSHMGAGEDTGLKKIAYNLNVAMTETGESRVMVLLETTAGQGTNLGYRFGQLKKIIDLVENKNRIGVCLDTCHIFAAGYDLRKKNAYENTIKEFDSVTGINNIKVIHINDSKKNLGSRVDRHEHIGKGFIGPDAFRFLINDLRFKDIPFILETPKFDDVKEDMENLRVLRSLLK